jgi:hypothetical protein
MRMGDVGRVVADYLLSSAGYNSVATQLTDRSGLGRDMPKTAGSVAYVTHSGFTGMRIDSGLTFQRKPFVLPMKHTIVALAHAQVAGGEFANMLTSYSDTYAASDHAWATPTGDLGPPSPGKDLTFNAYAGATGLGYGGSVSGNVFAPFSDGAWHVFVGVANPPEALFKARVDTGAIITVAAANQYRASAYTEHSAIGGKTITITGSNHATLARLAVFNGDLLEDNLAQLNDLVAALLLDPAL